ncbi:hypothetical protein N0V93_010272 [Gnomoniopsis smithogilvyi]|uniref:Uncharacterized protein n=1 Tax=Gnomoniopsis smithogilvyi TaxID=1191159 RepID=A0A9W8YKZ9_9PEZI|nr:hypothetical protein N0V93_010272 [Gnomoniopsis smithogilvyi]
MRWISENDKPMFETLDFFDEDALYKDQEFEDLNAKHGSTNVDFKTAEVEEHKNHHKVKTPAVLNLAIKSSRGRRISNIGLAEVELKFRSDQRRGVDWEVVAWGPFRYRKTWNSSRARSRINDNSELKLTEG